MQKHSDPYGFLANSMGAPHGDKDGCIALASNNSSNYFLMSSNSWGLCPYIDFHTGLGIFFQRYFMYVSQLPGWVVLVWAMYQGIHHNICIIQYVTRPCSSHPHLVKCGNAPFERSLSLYKIS